MITLTIRRPCPGCMPDGGQAFFAYAGGSRTKRYECSNCGHLLKVRARDARFGSPGQRSTLRRLERLAHRRFEIEGRGSVSGMILLSFFPRKWYDNCHSAWVGPRGGLTLEYDQGRKHGGRKTNTGWRAWIAANVYLGAR